MNQPATVAAELKAPEITQESKVEATESADVSAQPAEQIAELSEVDKLHKSYQKRIGRQTRKTSELMGRIDHLESLIRENQRPVEADDSQPDVKVLREQILSELKESLKIEQVGAKVNDILSRAAKDGDFDHDDFLESVTVTPVMRDTILESDFGDKLVKHLYKNPEEAERIASLSPARQAAEIGKLEDKLSQKPVIKKSGAPAPINPVGGTANVEPNIFDTGTSQADYNRVRAQQVKRNR